MPSKQILSHFLRLLFMSMFNSHFSINNDDYTDSRLKLQNANACYFNKITIYYYKINYLLFINHYYLL